MRITGAIHPAGDGTEFTREAWCQFIKSRPESRRRPLQQVPNPFKRGELMEIQPTEDTAQVFLDGLAVGSAHWSMSEEPCVIVGVEPSAMPLVLEWAAALGGLFREEQWE